jgi:hypothetical protein
MRSLICGCALASSLLFADSDIEVDLRNPSYKNGILYTDQGGVIRAEDLRIQAKSIQYIKRVENGKPVHRLEAEGDLMILYKGHVYVGSELEYDLDAKSGTVYDGKTFSSFWYVGGDKIQLNPDGSYRMTNAFFTTCENSNSSWDLHAGRINVLKDGLLEAKKVRFRFFKIPTFWLPSFKINLKKFKEPIFRYSLNWDKGQGPRAMARYQFYSWKNWALYGRLQYRWKTGWGGAFESEFATPHTTFVTQSYLGTDRLEIATNKQRRYRLRGALNSVKENTHTVLTWDKYSDVRMPQDFKSDDFEVHTAGRTLLYVHHQEENSLLSLKVRPRVNPFESIKQDLPTLFFTTRPTAQSRSGIIADLYSKASYLNFLYSDQLKHGLPHFASVRMELRPLIYRPFHLGPLIVTPRIGAIGIFYGSSQNHDPQGLASLIYGGSVYGAASRDFSHYRHVIKPYANYYGLTQPTVSPDHHYIFSIQDGYDRINQFQVGIRNSLFSRKRLTVEPTFMVDLYANAFFKDPVIPQLLPKLYLFLGWHLPTLAFSFHQAWNFQNQVLDFSNSRLQWTVNENVALALELRYRSPYDWRKADHENFILDVTRSESELLLSPLSDQRMTVLTHAFIRLTPFWECHLQSHHGFLRKNQNPYNEFKIDLFTWISSGLKLRLSYSHTQKDDRVTGGVELVKK